MERTLDPTTHGEAQPPEWFQRVVVRHMLEEDLPGLEWDGEFTHFRRLYSSAFHRAEIGLSVLWVAHLQEAGVIGQVFIQLVCDRPELADGHSRAYLYSFRIRPQYRSAGLGTKMLHILEDDLQQRGFKSVTLNVARDNPLARNLYEREGFVVVGSEPGIWSYPDHEGVWHQVVEPAWRMEKHFSD